MFDGTHKPDAPPCAVVGCPEPGKAHTCPYDDNRHGHGRVHYDCGYPVSSLTFRKGDWYLICDAHFEHVSAERAAFEKAGN